jgi:hypothetical protein
LSVDFDLAQPASVAAFSMKADISSSRVSQTTSVLDRRLRMFLSLCSAKKTLDPILPAGWRLATLLSEAYAAAQQFQRYLSCLAAIGSGR